MTRLALAAEVALRLASLAVETIATAHHDFRARRRRAEAAANRLDAAIENADRVNRQVARARSR